MDLQQSGKPQLQCKKANGVRTPGQHNAPMPSEHRSQPPGTSAPVASPVQLHESTGFDCLTILLGSVTILVAFLGVFAQNYAVQLAKHGEIPDVQGMYVGGGPDYEIAKAWSRDCRAYYRESSATLAVLANNVLLVSVVSGVATGWLQIPVLGIAGIVLWVVLFVVYLIRWSKRLYLGNNAERALEERRKSINSKQELLAARTGQPKTSLTPIPEIRHVRV